MSQFRALSSCTHARTKDLPSRVAIVLREIVLTPGLPYILPRLGHVFCGPKFLLQRHYIMNGDIFACFAHQQLVVAVSSTAATWIAVSDACIHGWIIHHYRNQFMQIAFPNVRMNTDECHIYGNQPGRSQEVQTCYLGNHPIKDSANTRKNKMECTSISNISAGIIAKPLQRVKHSCFTRILLQGQDD